MDLNEAIKHCEEVAEENEKVALYKPIDFCVTGEIEECIKYAEEHRQLAEWLKDYKRLKEQEPILDKIRAEIEKAVWEDVVVSLDGTDEVRIPRLDPDDVFEIIDKYKAESEN